MNTIIVLTGLMIALLGTMGALFLKKAATTFSFKRPFNPYLIIAGALYLIAVIPFILALRETDVSYMYPFIAIQYLLVSVIGMFVYEEKMTARKVGAMIIICIGVVLIGVGK